MCAFDLLATVADMLDRDSSPTSSNTSKEDYQPARVKSVWKNEDKVVKIEPSNQGSSDSKVLVSVLVQQADGEKYSSKESPFPPSDGHSGFASAVTTDCSENIVVEKLVNGKNKNDKGSFASKVDVGVCDYRESGDCKIDCETKMICKDELEKGGKVLIGTGADMCSLHCPEVWDGKPPALVTSGSNVKVPLSGDHFPHSSFPASREDVKIVSRDDDENSSGCTHPSTITKSSRPVSRIGDRRIRKILASKYWKVSPKLKDETLPNVGKLLLYSVWLVFKSFKFLVNCHFFRFLTSMICSFKLKIF